MHSKQVSSRATTQQAKPSLDAVTIALVIAAGVIAALHVGKGLIALPQMQHAFDRILAQLSSMLSVFAIVGLVGSIPAGALVQRLGDRRVLLVGLCILGLASLAGSATTDYGWLLGTRIVEGLGFLTVTVAAPSALNRLTPASRRSLVFGFWGTFMGIGIALSMLLGPWLGSWQNLWMLDGALTLIMAICIRIRVPAAPGAHGLSKADGLQGLRQVLRSRPTILLALSFALYNILYFSMMTFLPSYLMERVGLSMTQAGMLGAVIVLVNAAGNVLGGLCLQRGISPASQLGLGFLLSGLLGVLAYLSITPASTVLWLCMAFSAISGVLPATLLASVSYSAPTPNLTPMSLGLVMQGNYLGQVVAPLQAGALLTAFGWISVSVQIGIAAVLGTMLAWLYWKCD